MFDIAENSKRREIGEGQPWRVLGLLTVTLFTVFAFTYLLNWNYHKPGDSLNDVYQDAKPLQPFSLIDDENQVFGIDQLKGNWTFVAFGYTQCPDICPATLSQLSNLSVLVKTQVEQSLHPQYLFVSVDPARDQVHQLHDYIKYFDKDFVAATSDLESLVAFEDQFNVFHRYGKADSHGNYAVTHSGEIFLVDPKVRIVAKFTPPISTHTVLLQFQEITSSFPLENGRT